LLKDARACTDQVKVEEAPRPTYGRLLPYAIAIVLCAGFALFILHANHQPTAKAEIHDMLQRAVLSDDPGTCTEVYTPRFVRQLHPGRVNPLHECRRDADGTREGGHVRIRALRIHGHHADVNVAVVGGRMDGTAMKLLLLDAGGWQVDRMRDIDLDWQGFAGLLHQDLSKFNGTPREAKCIAHVVIHRVGKHRVEQAILDGRTDSLGMLGLRCLSDRTVRTELASGLRRGLSRDKHLRADTVDCVVDHTMRRIPPGRSRALVRHRSAARKIVLHAADSCRSTA
jgi:hypothetical protein